MSSSLLTYAKAAFLPRDKRCRRIPFGIGRGIYMDIDFSIQTRTFFGVYEYELNRQLRRLCQPGFNCFDVGGQFGYDALVLAKLGQGRVLSFECDPTASVELRHNVANNPRLRDKVEVVEAFVSARSDAARGQIALDDIAFRPEYFVPDFIKMDIEGAELDALHGAGRILEERHPGLLVETHSKQLETDCLEYVKALGYETEVIDQRRWFREHRPAEHNRWFVATHEGGGRSVSP